jgi:hypothetical protein
MGEISNRQVYDLALDISRNIGRLETSVDELLLEMRIHNQQMLLLSQFSQQVLKAPSR